jgi:antitoxin component of RelBE/YafQ-DinJ toxin-antitoxin module
MLASPQDQLNRWHEYFRNSLAAPLLHKNANTTELPVDTLKISSDAPTVKEIKIAIKHLKSTTTELPVDTLKISSDAPTVKEIKIAIKHLKSNKASSPDNLPPEIFKNYPHTVANILEPLLKKIWELGQIPKEWKQGLIIKLPKKGDLTECCNWRGITLLNIISKVLATIIYDRLKGETELKM